MILKSRIKDRNRLKKQMARIEKKYAKAIGQPLLQERLMKKATSIERNISVRL